MNTNVQNVEFSMFFSMFLTVYAHQDCMYLTYKLSKKTVMLWNTIINVSIFKV